MTTYRLMDGTSGRPGTGSSGTQPPASSTSYSGNYLAGLGFYVTEFMWLEGFWWYVADSSQTHASGQVFCLWQAHDATNTGALIQGTTVTGGSLSTGWNYIPYSTPVELAPNIAYHAQTGLTDNFPSTKNQFGTGDLYAAGIANGPLNAYSSGSGSNKDPWSNAQMPFAVSTSDPTAAFAFSNDADDNLWLDVQVTDTAPSGATYRCWPNMPYPSGASAQSVSYTLGMEFSVSASCTLEKIWHYSAPTSTVLPSRCGIWVVSTQTELADSDNSSPTWLVPGGGAASAGDGWIYCDYSASGVTLAASANYKVSTFANAGSSVWFAALANYWTASGEGLGGFTNGPLAVPDNAHATSPGQNSWNTGTTWTYPATSTNPESDWIDVEVLPAGAVTGPLAGSAAASAVFSGARTATGALTAAAAAAAVAAGAKTGRGALAGTTAAAAVTAGAKKATGTLAGSAAASATGTAARSTSGAIAGRAAASAAGAAAKSTSGALAGNAAASALVASSKTGRGAVAGSTAASGVLPGAKTGLGALAGAAAASAATAGAKTGTGALYGYAAADLSLTAVTSRSGPLSAAAAAAGKFIQQQGTGASVLWTAGAPRTSWSSGGPRTSWAAGAPR